MNSNLSTSALPKPIDNQSSPKAAMYCSTYQTLSYAHVYNNKQQQCIFIFVYVVSLFASIANFEKNTIRIFYVQAQPHQGVSVLVSFVRMAQ